MSNQWMYILVMMAVGAAMGTVFDIYNTVTNASRWLRWLRSTLDLLFWVASAVAIYLTVFALDNGRLRLYTFILAAAGYLFYRMTLHHRIVASAFTIIRVIEATVRGVVRFVVAVTVRPVLVVWNLLAAVLRLLYRGLCRLEDGVFWILKFWMRITLLPLMGRIPPVQRVWTRICAGWEEIFRVASNWLKTKMERV